MSPIARHEKRYIRSMLSRFQDHLDSKWSGDIKDVNITSLSMFQSLRENIESALQKPNDLFIQGSTSYTSLQYLPLLLNQVNRSHKRQIR